MLDFHGFEDKQIVRLRSGQLAGALQRKQVAALAGLARPEPVRSPTPSRRFVPRPSGRRNFAPSLPSPDHRRCFAVDEEAEISAGAFGGAPALPAEKVATLLTKVVLIARPSLSNHAAGQVTRLLLATKSKLAASWPEARQIPPAATDKGALLPAHPGTVAFLDAEQSDLLDKSTNVLLLGSLLTGLVGWLATRVATLRGRRKDQELKVRMQRLPVLLAQANGAAAEEFGAIEAELAQLSQWLLRKFMEDEISPTDFHRAEARLAHIGALIQKKRRSASLASIEQSHQAMAIVGRDGRGLLNLGSHRRFQSYCKSQRRERGGPVLPGYSGFTPDCLMIARYLALSCRTKALNCSTDNGFNVGAVVAQPRPDVGLSDATILLIPASSFATTSFGVARGANTPCHKLMSKSAMPEASATVGTSGAAGDRFAGDTAINLSLPALTR